MDLNTILVWTVAASCGMTLVQLLLRPRLLWPAALLPLGVGAVLAMAWQWHAPTAGYIGLAAWSVAFAIPALGARCVNWLLGKRCYGPAEAVAQVIAWLHPWGELWRTPLLVRAIHRLQQGRSAQALPLLDRLARDSTSVGRMALTMRTRHTGDWTGLLETLRSAPQSAALPADPILLDGYLQALGELGQRGELLAEFNRRVLGARSLLPGNLLNMMRLKAAAFCGQEALAQELVSGPLKELPIELRRYWLATARQAAGRADEAAATFHELAAANDAVAPFALRRLEKPVVALAQAPLSEAEQTVLERLAHSIRMETQWNAANAGPGRRCWGTWTLATAVVLAFFRELPGGSEDVENLIDLGAIVVPPAPFAVDGDWHRILSSAFLHFGPLHVSLNLLGLLYFGRRLERSWGGLTLLGTYLLAALGSMALTPWLMDRAALSGPTILIGASGGVMGLVGALLAQTIVDLIRERSGPSVQEFVVLCTVVVLQSTFDANTPEVSSEAHLLGLGIGAGCGFLVNLGRRIALLWRKRL